MFDQDVVRTGRSNFRTIKIYGQLKATRVETLRRGEHATESKANVSRH